MTGIISLFIVNLSCLFHFSSSEIPQYRLPYDAVNFEVEMMKDLGVKVQFFRERFSLRIHMYVVYTVGENIYSSPPPPA